MSTPKPTAYTPIRYLWLLTGCISFILGTAGIVLPVLPTVPFYMLTLFCFSRSSPKLHARFCRTQLYRRHVESFVKNRTMPRRTKYRIVTVVTLLMLLDAFYMRTRIWGLIILGIVWISHIIYFFFILKTEPSAAGLARKSRRL